MAQLLEGGHSITSPQFAINKKLLIEFDRLTNEFDRLLNIVEKLANKVQFLEKTLLPAEYQEKRAGIKG